MRYQEYQQKIEKLAKIRKFLFRYRVLFILSIAAVLSLTITLMAVSGTVTDADCPESCMYGSDLNFTANAVMQDVYYEYSVDGITWTTTQPTEIGTYKVRAVSHGLFGTKRTGAIHEFSILPQSINVIINESTITYGDLPTVSANLSYDDTITCSDFTFTDSTQDSTSVIPKASAVKITNKDGEDVTSSYEIHTSPKTLKLTQRFITLTVSDKEAVYSNVALTSDGYEVSSGSLATIFGDTIQATFEKSIINVGSTPNEPIFKIYNKDGIDVTSKYFINTIVGKLTIKQKQILINTGDYEEYYDGTSHSVNTLDEGISLETPLVDGHKLAIVGTTPSITNVASIPNIIVYKVLDENDNDVTYNYNLVVSYGTLKVNPRPITIESATSTLTYNGELQFDKSVTVTSLLGLVNEDVINVTPITKLINCSSQENKFDCKINTKDGEDNTSNYLITPVYGTLTISRRVVKIEANTTEYEYNGMPQFDKGYTVISALDFAKDQKVIVDTYSTLTVVGNTPNNLTVHVEDENGENVSDNNYEIQYIAGTLTIIRRKITITSNTSSHTYDGDEYYDEGINGNNIAPNQSIEVIEHTSVTDVQYDEDKIEVISIDNVLTYVIKDKDNNDVSSYYQITNINGSLTINKRPLSIKGQDKSWTYNDEDFSWTDYTIEDNTSLVKDHAISIVESSITKVKNVVDTGTENSFEIKIYSGSKDKTKNYDISYTFGTLTVNKRDILVIAGSDSKVYDGTALTKDEIASNEGIVSNHTIVSRTITGSQTDVGSSSNTIDKDSIVIENATGTNTTANYNISVQDGTLEVTVRPIEINTATDTKVYDGEALINSGYTLTTLTDLVDGQVITVTYSSSITDVGEKDNEFTIKITSGDTDVTSNYSITYVEGTLSITAKPITVTSKSNTWTYDSLEHSYAEENVGFTYTTLVSGHSIATIVGTKVTFYSEDTIYNEITITITDGTNDVTSNYDITYENEGVLTIEKRALEISTSSLSIVYDGQVHYGTYEADNLATNDEILSSNITLASIYNFGSTTNEVKSLKITDKANSALDRTSNYAITYDEGTLSISKRNISIKSATSSHVYDDTEYYDTSVTVTNDSTNTDEGLVSGETIVVTSYPTITNVGSKTNTIEVIIKSEDVDVSNNYNIDLTDVGTIEVTQRPITITADSKSKTYDGEPLTISNTEYTYSGLVDGHIISLTISGSITDAGTTPSAITACDIKKQTGDDEYTSVYSNYNVTLVDGTLTINKRELNITTGSKKFTYDATNHTCIDKTVTSVLGFVPGQDLVVNDSTKVKNVMYDGQGNIIGTDNIFTDYIVSDGVNDVTSNYDITFTYGTLTVYPYEVTITADSKSKTYDGKSLSLSASEYTNTQLIAGHSISSITLFGKITNVGTTPSEPSNAIIKDGDSNDVTSNYDITYVNGKLKVTPLAITITTDSPASKVYDATPLIGSYSVTGLLTDYDEILPANITLSSQTNVGTSDNKVLSIKITKRVDGSDSTLNYNISYITGSLEVTPRPIEINTATETKEYDGTSLSNNTFTLTNDSDLIAGHVINVLTYSTLTAIDSIDNEFTVEIKDGETDVTSNYQITFVKGTLTITKRAITIKADDLTVEYTGEAQSQQDKSKYTITVGSIAENQSLVQDNLVFTGSKVDIGTYENEISIDSTSITILDGDTDVTSNYDITLLSGTLTITKRTINIVTQTTTFTYDGEAHSYKELNAGYEITSGNLLSGDTLVVESFPTVQTVADGVVDNELTFSISGPNSSAYIINVSSEYGTISITKRIIEVKTNDFEGTYDGTEHYNDAYTLTSGSLVLGHTVSITSYTKMIDVAYDDDDNVTSIKNIITLTILDGDENDVSNNYDIQYVTGSLKLLPAELTIKTDTKSKEYDGDPLTGELDEPITGLASIDNIVLTFTSISNVSSVNNEVKTIEIYRLDGLNKVSSLTNYIITIEEGTLTITKRDIEFTIKGGEWVYDGEVHYNSEYELIDETDLLAGHKIIVENYAKIRNVGKITNYIEPTIVEEANELNILTANYNIIVNEDTSLEITKAALTIKLTPLTIEYDGEEHSSNAISTSGLAASDYVTVTSEGSGKVPGEYDNVLVEATIRTSSGEIANDNYNITLVDGIITITNRAITITSESAHDVYQVGKQYNHNVVTVTKGSIATGQKLITETITLAAQYPDGTPNEITFFDIVDIEDETISYKDYYDVTKVAGTYYIGNPYIYISTSSSTKFLDETDGTLIDHNYKLNDSLLMEGHYITVNVTGIRNGVGIAKNTVEYSIVDGEGQDVSGQYKVEVSLGTLEIKKRTIKITTGSGSWMYDGNTYSSEAITIDQEDLKDGHKLDHTLPTVTIKDVGKKTNSVEYSIVDSETGEEIDATFVSTYYSIITEFGILEVTARPIIAQSASDSKVYDGTALTNSRVDVLYDGYLLDGHTIQDSLYTSAIGSNTGSSTQTTEAENTIDKTKFVVKDADGNDVTSIYEIECRFGTLKVYATDKEEEDDDSEPLITILSTKAGTVYLKTVAYGNYKKTGSTPFNQATASSKRITVDGHQYSPDYIASMILKKYGMQVDTATIISYLEENLYPLPYYMSPTDGNYVKRESDALYTESTQNGAYTVGYYSISMDELKSILASGITLEGDLATEEAAYYAEVSSSSSQYMQIDDETKEYMDSIIVNNDLDNKALSIYQQITAVASFIQSSADYSLSYDSSLDTCDNVAVEFLKTYKIGVCRHYATSATMLYRALGIPARLVIGFVGNISTENEPTDIYIDTYHAWVEVYIQGFGWVSVEVTGGGNYGGYDSEGELDPDIEDLPEELTFTVRPVEVTEEYDATEHQPTEVEILGLEEYGGIEALELLGYNFAYELNGSRVTPGIVETSIKEGSFHIYKGNQDITDKCHITYQTNELTVSKCEITILSSSGSWNYDGKLHSKDSYTIVKGEIAEGDKEYVTCISSIIDIGTVNNDFNYYILDSDNMDVTSYYNITKQYGVLEIAPNGLIITTNSETKIYDGTPLVNTDWSEENNMIGTLLDGHHVVINITGTITEVGSIENSATVDIVDEDGNSVKDYYAVDLRCGTLTVTTKKITVYTGNNTKTYDGTPLSADPNDYEYTQDVLTSEYSIEIEITGKTPNGNAQTVRNTCIVTIMRGGEDVTDEFEIEYILGSLTIYQKNIYINTASKSIYFDGVTSVSCPEYTYIDGSGLLSGHSIYTAQNWAVLSSIPDDAEFETNDLGEKYYSIKNSAEFVIVDASNNDVSANYRFLENNFGKLSLVLKKIEVGSGNKEKVYDGTPLTFPQEEDEDFYLTGSLFEGHTVFAILTGTITEPGTVENSYQIIVLNTGLDIVDELTDEVLELYEDVTYLYDISTSFGTLTVTKRVIVIETASDSKKYDGTPLTNSTYTIISGNVLESLGHMLYVNVTGSALDKTQKNTAVAYAYMLVDEESVRLDNLYQVKVVEGTLEIQERKLSISSKGATKEYDGTPLVNNSVTQIEVHETACIEEGHNLYYSISDDVAITKVGEIPNTVTYYLTDEDGNDVTYLYVVEEDFGYLVITPAQIVIETGSKKSNDTTSPLTYDSYKIISGSFFDEYVISVTGQQVGLGQSNNTYEFNCVNSDCYAFTNRLGLLVIYDETNTNYAQVYSTASTTMFLKEASYGEYTKTSWTSAPTYSGMLDSTHSMSYLTSIVIDGQIEEQSARILAYSQFALPYYMSINNTSNNQTSDAVNSGSINNEYQVLYYALNYNNISSLSYNLGDYATLEQAYRTYVYENYLDVPSTTATAINAAIDMSVLNPSSSAFISNVIDTVKAAGTNDPNYNTAIDSSSDFVASFLGYKKGVSKHFASLATLIFRMLGVPARYTVGAYGDVQANSWSNIPLTNRLSYVEIYIDNVGWVQLDVTPAAGEDPDDPDDPDDPEELIAITISPVDKEKAYDGTPLTPDNTLDETEEDIAALLALGYTYEVTVSGSQTEKGTSDSTITSFTLYNALHEDVTDKYNVTFNTGTLKVTNVQILVYLDDYSYTYDGQAHAYGSLEVFWDYDMPSGFNAADYELSFNASSISLTKAGSVNYDDLRACACIMNGSDDVTDSFYLVFDGDGLQVTQKSITITSGSSSKPYDGTTLTNDKYQITIGSLATGDTIDVSISGSQSKVGSSANTIESVIIRNSLGEDITESYSIKTIEGTLTLT